MSREICDPLDFCATSLTHSIFCEKSLTLQELTIPPQSELLNRPIQDNYHCDVLYTFTHLSPFNSYFVQYIFDHFKSSNILTPLELLFWPPTNLGFWPRPLFSYIFKFNLP